MTDVPEQPRTVVAVEIHSRHLILTWMAPHDNNAEIQGYFVSYRQPAFAEGGIMIENVIQERVNVTNLFPGVTYNFSVTAYNNIGNSTKSETTPLRTMDEGLHSSLTP